MPELKQIKIERRVGFRQGIKFRFAGQLLETMTPEQQEQYALGEFEPAPLSEPFDEVLEVPPLNFEMLQRFQDDIATLSTMAVDVKTFKKMVGVISLALARNYKGIPIWLIEQSLDVANLPRVMESLMDVSGLLRKAQDDAEEKKILAEAQKTSGTTSTPTSSPQAAQPAGA